MPLNMFRIVFKRVPANALKNKCCTRSSTLYNSIRFCQGKAGKQDLCPGKPKPPKSRDKLYTFGTIALIGGGTLAYAKSDPDFREWLGCNVPYSEEFMKFIFQEEKTYIESFIALLDAIKASVLSIFFGDKEHQRSMRAIKEESVNYVPPTPAFESLARDSKDAENYAEIRLEQIKKGQEEPIVTITGEAKVEETLAETHPKSISELETKVGISATATIQAYNKAVYALKNYNQDVQIVIEDSVDRLDPEIWNSLRQKSKAKEQAIKDVVLHAKQINTDLEKLKAALKQPNLDVPSALKQQAEINMKKIKADIEDAKYELEKAELESNITDKYWKKVEEARSHFIDEIEILFPGVNISEKKLELEGSDLDLFILHAFANVLYYQKELYKLQILEEQKLKAALEHARRGHPEILSEAQIDQKVEKERRNLAADFHKRCLCLRVDSERELRQQLKLQSETFSDHLSDALKVQEMELGRDFARKLDEKVTEERCKFKLQLSALAGRVRGMDKALKARAESDKIARQSQVLWSACQALHRALKAGCPGLPWTEQLRPLDPEIMAVEKAAADSDELVHVVIEGIPRLAKERGVFPEDALRERFLNVEKAARQLSLVPEGGARLPLHVLSYLQSILLLKAASPIPQAELDDEAVDFANLSTNDILQRARYWMDRGDFAQTLRYMNLLEGASRCAAHQWMEETRILLETQQAANTLMAHAAATGLTYL